MLIGTKQQLAKVQIDGIGVGKLDVFLYLSVDRNLSVRIFFDSDMSMTGYINVTFASAPFYYLYNFRHLYKYLSVEVPESFVHALET